MIFEEKSFSILYSMNWPNFTGWLSLLLEILSNTCIVIIFCSVCDVINFGINFNLPIKPFFYITKSRQKWKYQERKEIFTWNKKHFSSVLKVFPLSEIFSNPSVDLSNICYNKSSFLFQMIAMNIYRKQSLSGVPWN